MLVLTRSVDDSIMIGDDVKITIPEINGSSVKIGISAPRELSVHRSEVYVRVNRSATQPARMVTSPIV